MAQNRCRACGWNLRLIATNCPQCGTPVSIVPPPQLRENLIWAIVAIPLLIVVTGIGVYYWKDWRRLLNEPPSTPALRQEQPEPVGPSSAPSPSPGPTTAPAVERPRPETQPRPVLNTLTPLVIAKRRAEDSRADLADAERAAIDQLQKDRDYLVAVKAKEDASARARGEFNGDGGSVENTSRNLSMAVQRLADMRRMKIDADPRVLKARERLKHDESEVSRLSEK